MLSSQMIRVGAIAALVLWSSGAPAQGVPPQIRDMAEQLFRGMAAQQQQSQQQWQLRELEEAAKGRAERGQRHEPVEPATPVATILPGCSDPESIMKAFKLGLQNDLGHMDLTLADLMIIVESYPLGIDQRTGAKKCRAIFRADIDKARQIESFVRGRHPMTEFAYGINQAYEAGRPASTTFIIQPDGEGGTLITPLREPNSF
jgi:hypothetical protein